MTKYLGSKCLLLPLIVEIARRSSREPSVIDLFSGTARVGHALKAAGFRVLANDHNRYAATLARCYVAADSETQEAADRVDSTTGVQMAYLKQWAARALEADVAYLDPPYNQHKYLGNYHVWETLCRRDHPEVYGVARKRIDCKSRGSAFNSRRLAADALATLIKKVKAEALVVSFSDEGYVGREEMTAMLAPRGRVYVVERPYRRYVGARIGIYNPGGEKVGKIGRLDNRELVFVATRRDMDLGDLIEMKQNEPLLFA